MKRGVFPREGRGMCPGCGASAEFNWGYSLHNPLIHTAPLGQLSDCPAGPATLAWILPSPQTSREHPNRASGTKPWDSCLLELKVTPSNCHGSKLSSLWWWPLGPPSLATNICSCQGASISSYPSDPTLQKLRYRAGSPGRGPPPAPRKQTSAPPAPISATPAAAQDGLCSRRAGTPGPP